MQYLAGITVAKSPNLTRGKIGTNLLLLKILGSLLPLSIRPYISYLALGILGAISLIVFDHENACTSLNKLSSNTADNAFIGKQIMHIQEIVEADIANKGSTNDFFTRKYAFLIFLVFGVKTLQQFCGNNALASYLKTKVELTAISLLNSPALSLDVYNYQQERIMIKNVTEMLADIKKSRYIQYLAALAANLSVATNGMGLSWPSPSLPLLQSHESPLGRSISDEEASWVVSSFLIVTIPTAVVSGWAIDKYGRKKSLLFTALLTFIQWIIIIFAKSVQLLIVARILGGMGMGIAVMATIIYNGEISEPDIRGKISTYLLLMKIVGSLIVLSIGPYVSYLALAIICAIGPIVFFCAFYFMPESPYYFIKSGNFEDARKSLIMLSSNTADDKFIDEQMTHIQKTIEADMANKGSVFEFFTRKYAFLIFLLFGIKTLQQLSGTNALASYLQTIIELTDSGLSPEVSSIIIGSIQLPAVYLSGLLVDRLGRKPLLITSAIGCAIALFGEGTYFYIQDYLQNDTSSISWLPTSALALFWIMNTIGVYPLPYVLLGELFPTNVKGIAVATASVYGGLTSFIVTKFFKPLSNAVGIYTTFYMFTGICIAGAIFVSVFVPETKGKNFAEIQELLNKGKNRNKTCEKEEDLS